MASAARGLARTARTLDRLDAAAADASTFTVRAPLSRWCVGEHLEHLAAANALCIAAIHALVDGTDERIAPRACPRPIARLIFLLNWIPRGKGKAPDPTRPPPEIDPEGLRERLAAGRARFDALTPAAVAAAQGAMAHPILGDFDARQWVRFTQVHVHHHLKIVDDMLATR